MPPRKKTSRNASDSDISGVLVIEKAAAILRVLGQREAQTIAEMTRECGLPRTTVQRLALALQAQQFLTAVDGRYSLGPAITKLASSARMDVIAIARPHIERLAKSCGETVNVSVVRGNHAVIVDQIQSESELRVATAPGSALPLHCTAHGKATLALMSEDEIGQRLVGKWEKKTEKTALSLTDLQRELHAIRKSGVAFDEDEHCEGVSAVGVAIETQTVERYAISVALPSVRFRQSKDVIAKSLLRCARAIEANF